MIPSFVLIEFWFVTFFSLAQSHEKDQIDRSSARRSSQARLSINRRREAETSRREIRRQHVQGSLEFEGSASGAFWPRFRRRQKDGCGEEIDAARERRRRWRCGGEESFGRGFGEDEAKESAFWRHRVFSHVQRRWRREDSQEKRTIRRGRPKLVVMAFSCCWWNVLAFFLSTSHYLFPWFYFCSRQSITRFLFPSWEKNVSKFLEHKSRNVKCLRCMIVHWSLIVLNVFEVNRQPTISASWTFLKFPFLFFLSISVLLFPTIHFCFHAFLTRLYRFLFLSSTQVNPQGTLRKRSEPRDLVCLTPPLQPNPRRHLLLKWTSSRKKERNDSK